MGRLVKNSDKNASSSMTGHKKMKKKQSKPKRGSFTSKKRTNNDDDDSLNESEEDEYHMESDGDGNDHDDDKDEDDDDGDDDDIHSGEENAHAGFVSVKTELLVDDWEDAPYLSRLSDYAEASKDEEATITTDFGAEVDASVWNKMYEYQREGVKWMFKMYKDGVGGILVSHDQTTNNNIINQLSLLLTYISY